MRHGRMDFRAYGALQETLVYEGQKKKEKGIFFVC